MKGVRRPLFLARRSYRRRRLVDAARLLPVLGVFLLMLPVLWAPEDEGSRATARDGIYLFLVWFGLIAAAALIARRLSRGVDTVEDSTARDGGEAG